MLILIFINIFIIVWIYSKYYNYSQNENIEKNELSTKEFLIDKKTMNEIIFEDGIVWLYIMLTIIVAFSADITKIR